MGSNVQTSLSRSREAQHWPIEKLLVPLSWLRLLQVELVEDVRLQPSTGTTLPRIDIIYYAYFDRKSQRDSKPACCIYHHWNTTAHHPRKLEHGIQLRHSSTVHRYHECDRLRITFILHQHTTPARSATAIGLITLFPSRHI